MKKVLVIAIALTLVITAVALAGENPNAKIAIHIRAHGSCKGLPAFTSCSGIVFNYTNAVGDIDAMPVFYDLTQYTVTEFGMTWPAEWASMSWTRCLGNIGIGTITNPGEGTAISFPACMVGTAVAPGYGWLAPMAQPGLVTPVPNPATGDCCVVGCNVPLTKDFPMCISSGGYLMVGDDPCRPTATEPSTWGSIKSMFE